MSKSTLLSRQLLQVDQDGKVIARLDRRHIAAVLSLQHLLSAILNQVLETPYLNREQNPCLAFRGRDMEGDAVKVGDGLVDGRGRGTGPPSVMPGAAKEGGKYPENRSVRMDWIRTFW